MTNNNNINSLHIYQSEMIDSIQDKINFCIWDGYVEKENCISIPKYLENNGDILKKKYIEFIYYLGNQKKLDKTLIQNLYIKNNYNLWWMSLLTEKSHYKSPRIKDCLKLLALEEILLKHKPNEVILHINNEKISRSINYLSKNLGIKISIAKSKENKNYKNKYKSKLNLIYYKSPFFLQSFVYLFYKLVTYWPLRKTAKVKWNTSKNSILFFSYLFHLNLKKYKEGRFKTGQWGPLNNLIEKLSIKTNWIHHYIKNPIIKNTKTGINFINKLNSNTDLGDKHQFMLSFLNVKCVLNIFINYFKVLFRYSSLIKFRNLFITENKNINFWYFLENDFKNSILGPKLIENLLWIEIFDKAFSEIPYQNKGIYLQENQSWEKALITSWKINNHGKLMALNNGFVRFWDTRFFDDPRIIKDISNDKMPLPDSIILTDSISWKYYLDSGYLPNKLIKGESLRYFDINKQPIEKNNKLNKSIDKKSILLLGDIIFDTTDKMLNSLEGIKDINNYYCVFKSHPACLIDVKNYKNIKLENTEEDIKDIIYKFDVVIAPAATLSVLDAYLSGVKVIIFLGKDEINLSPLRGFSEVNVVFNTQTMKKALNLEIKKNIPLNNDNLFWHNKELILWKNIIS